MADVFISYSSVDRTIADAVCAALESNGVSCWIAPRDIRAGSYAAAIVGGINESKLVALIFSASSNKSPQVEREIERAVSKNKVIYPLRIENVLPAPDLELFISSEQWMDAFERPIEPRLEIFAQNVKQLLSATPAPAGDSVTNTDKNNLSTTIGPAGREVIVPRATFWTIASAVLLLSCAAVAISIIMALLKAGLDPMILLCDAIGVLLFLLAGSPFLPRGRVWLKKLFALVRINSEFKSAARTWFVLAVLVILIALRLLFPPSIGRYFDYKGDHAFSDKQFVQAIANYERAQALSLSAAQLKLANSHFSLALQYDKARTYSAAAAEYDRALQYDPDNYAASNNLARVYILQGDPARALVILNRLQKELASLPVSTQYFLYKNLGWANLELHNYRTAEGQLTWALVKKDGSAAQYLLGRLYDEQGRAAEATGQWNNFIRALQSGSEAEEEVEPNWIAQVQEKLHER